MHESGVFASLLQELERLVAENQAKRVSAIELVVGALETSDDEHLREHFRMASQGTIAEGAELTLVRDPNPLSAGFVLRSVELET